MAHISLVIPCFNEAENIGDLLTALSQHAYLKEAEIIIIDDGSKDKSVAIIEDFISQRPHFRLLKHGRNRGYGQALITGMKEASNENVIWMDSDGQHRLEDVEKIAKILVADDVDFVVGERDAKSHQVKSRLLGKFVLRQLVRLAGVRQITDFNSGLRGFKTALIRRYLHLLSGGFGASTTTTLLMEMRGYSGQTVSITVLDRMGVSSVRQVRDGLRTMLLIVRALLLFRPMRFFMSIGLSFLITGLVYGFWIALSQRLGFPVFGSMLVLAGIQTIVLGLVTDQISQMRLEKFE